MDFLKHNFHNSLTQDSASTLEYTARSTKHANGSFWVIHRRKSHSEKGHAMTNMRSNLTLKNHNGADFVTLLDINIQTKYIDTCHFHSLPIFYFVHNPIFQKRHSWLKNVFLRLIIVCLCSLSATSENSMVSRRKKGLKPIQPLSLFREISVAKDFPPPPQSPCNLTESRLFSVFDIDNNCILFHCTMTIMYHNIVCVN